jgi:hypothetical protein
VKYMSFALAGLFVVTIAAPASADDGATGFNRNQAHYEFEPGQASKYFAPQKAAELHLKLAANYTGCKEALHELGWNNPEES